MAARTIKQSTTDCWNFQGCAVGPNGYGQISVGPRKLAYAHRVAWLLAHPEQEIPEGMRVLHSCDNPRCVNPAHLSLGTQHENILDSIRKGRYNCFGIQKLNADQVREIRALGKTGLRHADIGARFGIARNTVSQIISGKTWAHLAEHDAEHVANVEPVQAPAVVRVPFHGDLQLRPVSHSPQSAGSSQPLPVNSLVSAFAGASR